MRFRKLRIAWSVFWGMVAVLVAVLWVRSYRAGDFYVSSHTGIQSAAGRFMLFWNSHSQKWKFPDPRPGEPIFGKAFERLDTHGGGVLFLAHWFVLLPIATAAIAPWILHLRFRFSLRTLLIATTLIAVVLGLVVWLSS